MTLIYPPHPDLLMRPPKSSDFTWVNQGSASVTDTPRGMVLSTPAPSTAGDNIRILTRSVPTPPYTVTVRVIPHLISISYLVCGIGWRESSSGKLTNFQILGATRSFYDVATQEIEVAKFNSPTSWNSTYVIRGFYPSSAPWLRMVDDGTSRSWHFSNDGTYWFQLHSVSRTDFITPDEIFFFVNSTVTTYGCAMTVLHWEVS